MKKMVLCCLSGTVLLLLFSLGALAAPPSEDYVLTYADEFEGDALNQNDWHYRTGTKHNGVDLPSNVEVKDGRLVIHFVKQDVGGKAAYTGGGIISNTGFGYGYYETKCKLFGETGGLHSSFWTAGESGDGINIPKYNSSIEIDIFEQDSDKPEVLAPNFHYWLGAHTTEPKNKLPYEIFDASKEEFVIGLEYLPDRLNWYINGQLTTTVSNPKLYAMTNLWLTALANTVLSGEIDDSKLPGQSSWDYFRFYTRPLKGSSLAANGSFELNVQPHYEKELDLDAPVFWTEQGDQEASKVALSDDKARTGDAYLLHQSNGAYRVTTNQKLTNIHNGTYSLTAYVRSSGGQKECTMFANDTKLSLPASPDLWTKVTLENVVVTDNLCNIGFTSDSGAAGWLAVDDVEFTTQEGTDEYNIKSTGISAQFVQPYPGEILIDDLDKGCVKFGKWTESGTVKGYIGKSFYSNDAAAWVSWAPPALPPGEYTVQVYNPQYDNNDTAVRYTVTHQGGTAEKTVNTKEGTAGWITLGTYVFSPNQAQVVASRGNGYLRADCVRFIPANILALDHGILMKTGVRRAFVNNQKVMIDKENLAVVPYTENGRTLVPLRFLAESLGAQVAYKDGTGKITITQSGTNLELTVGADEMLLNGSSIQLDCPAATKDGRTFVPLRAVSEAFGKEVDWDESGLITVTESAFSIQDPARLNDFYFM